MKTIIFGPWTGEFSYEVQWWVSEIRKIALQNECKAIMVGYPGRQALYRDFIDEYIEFPETLLQYCNNPNCWAQRDQNTRNLYIPKEILKFYDSICFKYDNVFKHMPTPRLIDKRFLDHPEGISKTIDNYDINVEDIINDILLNFEYPNTICIVPKLRRRDGFNPDHETWDIKIWETIIDACINDLNLNIISFLFRVHSTNPGTYDFSHFCEKYKHNFKQIDLKHPKSLDIQIALLKNTSFSVYGSTGAAILPIMCNTKMITFQTKEAGWRLNFEWQRKLTNNHEFIHIIDKYPSDLYKNMNVKEIFESIKNYKNKLG